MKVYNFPPNVIPIKEQEGYFAASISDFIPHSSPWNWKKVKHPRHKNGYIYFPHVREARGVSNENLGLKVSRNVEILTFNGVIFEKMASEDFGKAFLVRVVCRQGKSLKSIFFGLGRSIDT